MPRTQVRCPVCRSVLPAVALWTAGEVCPRCNGPLYSARRRSNPAGVLGKALSLLRAQPPPRSVRARAVKRLGRHG
jgi:hypothetical protein